MTQSVHFFGREPPCLVNDTPLTANLHSLFGVSKGSGHPEIGILTALEYRKPTARAKTGLYKYVYSILFPHFTCKSFLIVLRILAVSRSSKRAEIKIVEPLLHPSKLH